MFGRKVEHPCRRAQAMHVEIEYGNKMKTGFLGSRTPSVQALAKDPEGDDQHTPNKKRTEQKQHKPQDVVLSPEHWASNFEQCLQLLAGPADETRFVGLLLAVKLLPQGGDEALRRVLSAVGWPFIQRLLHPLTVTHPPPMTAEQQEQQQLCACLGLSMLGALCRLPEVAHGPELRQLLPTLVGVLARGGTGPDTHLGTAAHKAGGQQGVPNGPALDWVVVADVLECLLAATSQLDQSGQQDQQPVADARMLLQQANGLEALTQVLSQAVVQGRGCGWQPEQLGVVNVWRLPVMATCLIRMCLNTTDAVGMDVTEETGIKVDAQATESASMLLLLPTLCHLLGLPEILDCKSASAVAQERRTKQLQQEHQQLELLKQQEKLEQQQQEQQEQKQALMQQQELPALEQEDMATQQHQQPVRPDQQPLLHQPTQVHQPTQPLQDDAAVLQLEALHVLQLLLTRHSHVLLPSQIPESAVALQALLAVSETNINSKVSTSTAKESVGWAAAARRGLGWVLRGRRLGEPQRHAALQVAAGLVQVLGASWLITPPSRPSRMINKGGKGPGQHQVQQELVVVLSETLQIELGLLLRDALHGEDSPASTAAWPAVPTPIMQTGLASQRALDRLPAVLSLLEALLDALACDTDRDKDTMDMTFGTATAKSLPVQHPPSLSPAMQQQLLQSVSASVQLVVAFLQSVSDMVPGPSQAQEVSRLSTSPQLNVDKSEALAGGMQITAAVPPPAEVLLACTRLVGHYLAEAPDAMDSSVLAVLHVMFNPAGLGRQGEHGEVVSQLDDLAVDFLLPGLLQVISSPSSNSFQQVMNTLCQPHTISLLSAALSRAAKAALDTAAAARHTAERRLADLCMLLVHVLEPRAGDFSDVQLHAAQALWPSFELLAQWASVQAAPVCNTKAVPSGSNSSPANDLVEGLVAVGLWPRAVLCSATLGALVLQASLSWQASGKLQAGADAAQISLQLRSVCELVTMGLGVGRTLTAALLMEETHLGSVVGSCKEEAAAYYVLQDVSGDGEHCWEVLLSAVAACVLQVPELQVCVRESSAWEALKGGAQAVQPLTGTDMKPLYAWAVAEVEGQSVGWQLLRTRMRGA